MKTKMLFALITLLLASTAFSSGTTIGNGISVNTTKAEKTCKKDGKEIKVPIDQKCEEEVPAEKPKEAPKK